MPTHNETETIARAVDGSIGRVKASERPRELFDRLGLLDALNPHYSEAGYVDTLVETCLALLDRIEALESRPVVSRGAAQEDAERMDTRFTAYGDDAWALTKWILGEWKGDGLACERICQRIREYAAEVAAKELERMAPKFGLANDVALMKRAAELRGGRP